MLRCVTPAAKTFSIGNPYLPSKHAITYSVTQKHDGWRIEATFPKRVSSSDKMRVLDWFHEYRANVIRTNPLWRVAFNATSNSYVLEIYPARDIRELAEAAETVKRLWHEAVE
jgi:hypothetical protein